MSRWLIRAALSIAALIGLVIVAAGVGYGWLQTDSGRRWVEARLEIATDGRLRVEQLQGALPFEARAGRLILSDATGSWLSAEQVRFSIRPAALLRLHVDVQMITAKRVEFARLPVAGPSGSPEDDSAPPVPRLPVSVEIAQLSASEILLARPVLGAEARLSLSGSGALDEGSARLALDVRRLDAPGGAHADIVYDGRQLALDLDLADPGGLVARALGAQSDLPATLRASGAGPLANWRGAVEAGLGEARSHLAIALDNGRLTVSGILDPRPLLQPDLAALLPEPLQVEAGANVGAPFTLERLALSSGGTRLSFEGALQLEGMTGSGRAELALPDAAVLKPLLGVPLHGEVTGTAAIDTSAEGQSADLALQGEAIGAEGYRARSLTLTAHANRSSGAEEIEVEGVLRGFGIARSDGKAAAILPADLTLAFEGSISPSEGKIVARRLSLTGEGAEISFAGTARLDGFLDGTVRLSAPEIAPLAAVGGLEWTGALSLEAGLQARPGGDNTRFTVDGAWQDPQTGILALDSVLGEKVTLSATGAAFFDGALDIEQARVAAGEADLSLSGRLEGQGPLDLRFELKIADLAALAAGTGQQMKGEASILGTLVGTADALRLQTEAASPSLTIASTHLRALTLAVDLADLTSSPHGTTKGSVTIEGIRTDFHGNVSLTERLLSLKDLRAQAHGTSLAGNLEFALESHAVIGILDLTAPSLTPWSKLAGLPLGGLARANIRLKPDGSAIAEATGSGLDIGDVRIAKLRVEASLQQWRDRIAGRIDLAAERIKAGAAFIDTASVRIEPAAGAFALQFAGSGTAAAPFTLNGTGAYESAPQRLSLTQLNGTYAEKPVRLRSATSFTFAPGIAAAPFDLDWGDARIGGEFALGPRLSGSIRATDLPVQDLALLAGPTQLKGTARALLAFSGTASDPIAKLTATISKLSVSGGTEKVPEGDLAITAELNHSRLDWRAELSSVSADLSVSASGILPMAWTDPPFGVTVAPSGPVHATVRGSGEIAPLVAFAGIDEDRASGRYVIDLTLAGGLDDPSLSGSASVEKGSYENFTSGATLRDISLQANGASDRLELALTATDGAGGRIEGGGVLRLDGVNIAALDLTARLADFHAIRRDDVQARATGALALAGPFDELTLSGRVRLERMTVILPERSPVGASKFDVIEVNAAAANVVERDKQADQRRAAKAVVFKIGLDVNAELPVVDVTGRGLNSQWRGHLHVGGTTVTPRIRGKMHLHRGTFNAFSKLFTLTEGEIVFDGGAELNPSVRIIAEREVRDAVARVTLTGSLSSPLVEFSARPELPVDEVLARLLFDKGAGQMGAAEALQLAQVAAALQEGGTSTGAVDQIGQKLGLDRIDVRTVKTEDKKTGKTGEAAALSLGKNISEDVQVGVEQGIDPGTGGVTMGVDLGKNLTVESRVGTQGSGGVGLKWKYDY